MTDDLFQRLSSDADFRRRVETHYDGDDLLDVAWWLQHPLEDAPSGSPSAERGLHDLERRAYARPSPGRPADISVTVVELEAARAQIASSRARLLEAVELAEQEPKEKVDGSRAGAPDAVPSPACTEPARRRWWPFLVTAVVAAVLGVMVGAGGASVQEGAAPENVGSGSETVSVPEGVVLQDFEREQTPEDVPSWIPPRFDADTFRKASPTRGESAARARAYLARDEAGRVCMVIVDVEAEQTFSSCGVGTAIPTDGLRVQHRFVMMQDGQPWQVDISGEVTPGGTALGSVNEGPSESVEAAGQAGHLGRQR